MKAVRLAVRELQLVVDALSDAAEWSDSVADAHAHSTWPADVKYRVSVKKKAAEYRGLREKLLKEGRTIG